MNKNIELLAPAGTYEAFLAAVENGADAVYMGGKLFNARANASNFDISELAEIVKYAHLRNVKIHITMNTLLDDDEIAEALKFANELYNIGVDAVIVQDLGLAKVLHENLPNLSLHASTQLSTHTLEGVEELSKIGFSRVVLARELSIEEIKHIVSHTSTEIEIFAHGALCVSYSGQCLMSSMIGDRSGNRGKCAQPCRLPYTLISDDKELGNGYLLSPKDLATLEILDKIPNVASLKIEGRMKSPEYVATVISTYRKYIDKSNASSSYEIDSKDKSNLLQIFNRGGFSTGYLEKKLGKDMMCYEKPKNWGIYIGKVLSYDGKRYIKIKNETNETLNIGDGIEIWNGSNNSPSTIISEIDRNKIGRIKGEISPNDKVYKTLDKSLNTTMRETFSRGFRRHSLIDLTIKVVENSPIIIKINDFTYESNIVPEKATNQPITEEKVISQFSKTGNTPFGVNKIDVQLGNELFVAVSVLNELRRNAIEEYEKFLLASDYKNVTVQDLPKPAIYNKLNKHKETSVFFNILREEYLKLKNVTSFYFTFKDALNNLDLIANFKGNKYILLPTITKENYDKLIKNNIDKIAQKVDGFVLSNIGQLKYISNIVADKKPILIANYTFNAFNTYTIELLKKLGFSKVILSPELTKSQINTLGSSLKREVIAYGNTCVMTTSYCPLGSIIGGLTKNTKCSKPCTNCYPSIRNTTNIANMVSTTNVKIEEIQKFYLRDRMDMDFRVLPDNIDCISRIFNSKITSIETEDLNIDSIRIDVIDEDVHKLQQIIDTHRNGKKLTGNEYTNGHYARPV